MSFTVKRVLRRGSEKEVSRRSLECPLGEYALLGVRPKYNCTRTTSSLSPQPYSEPLQTVLQQSDSP